MSSHNTSGATKADVDAAYGALDREELKKMLSYHSDCLDRLDDPDNQTPLPQLQSPTQSMNTALTALRAYSYSEERSAAARQSRGTSSLNVLSRMQAAYGKGQDMTCERCTLAKMPHHGFKCDCGGYFILQD
jgi:hypothetical protein